ncbi:MAG: carbohydrate-binding family 9-like protein [Alphaproteobacteria bacterium]|nr:carbohydrate-binding family 9-like protein [Alphaproteobacteria bacterium]
MKNITVLLSSACLSLTMVAPALGQVQRHNLAPIPTYEVHRAKISPRIDGKLDDAAWQAAKPVTFVFPWTDQTGKKQKTVARLIWDSENLYVAYECEDSDITAVYTQHDDPTYKDDAVEIFIAPPGVKNLYLGLEMNARAILYDYLYPFPQRIIKNYNLPGVRVAVSSLGTLNKSSDQDHGTQPSAFAMVGFGHGETGSALSGPVRPALFCGIARGRGCLEKLDLRSRSRAAAGCDRPPSCPPARDDRDGHDPSAAKRCPT